ncbi:MAG: hypothetical protein HUU48_03130 [Flavobacteriales bacterium]|nr:hypothetical protein [Flavobacteriales bacterium]
MEVLTEITTGNAQIKKCSNGMLIFKHLEGIKSLNLSDFVENYEGILRLQSGCVSPLLGNVTNIEDVENEAKAFMTKTLPTVANALAFVNEKTNTVTSFAINMYLYLHRPQIPVKVFSSEEKALKWLNGFL